MELNGNEEIKEGEKENNGMDTMIKRAKKHRNQQGDRDKEEEERIEKEIIKMDPQRKTEERGNLIKKTKLQMEKQEKSRKARKGKC